MPLILSGNVATATAAAAYDVDNSCRFNDGDSATMHKTPTGAGDRQKFTFSFWVKRCNLTVQQVIYDTNFGGGASEHRILFDSSDRLEYYDYASSSITLKYVTTRVFRDVSAWYNIIIAVDTTDSTAGNRVKIYINGTLETAFGTETDPAEDLSTSLNTAVKHQIGTKNVGANYLDAYLAEFVFIDGTQYANTDFGEFNSDSPTIWQPIDVSELTFGTNGFYLDFKASDNLGNDANGGTDLTEVNLDATDSATDTPTNNFCTANPLANFYNQTTFSEGNCKVTLASSPYGYDIGTFGVANGKWYWEIKYTSGSGDPHNVGHFGISGKGESLTASAGLGHQSGSSSTDYGYADEGGTGVLYTNESGSNTDASRSFAIGNIIGIAIDLDSGTHTMTLSVNGSATTTDNISSSPTSGFYFPAWGYGYSSGGAVFELNFGGSPAFTVSSGNADDNGYGNFEYAPPSGYLALCSKNLGEEG